MIIYGCYCGPILLPECKAYEKYKAGGTWSFEATLVNIANLPSTIRLGGTCQCYVRLVEVTRLGMIVQSSIHYKAMCNVQGLWRTVRIMSDYANYKPM